MAVAIPPHIPGGLFGAFVVKEPLQPPLPVVEVKNEAYAEPIAELEEHELIVTELPQLKLTEGSVILICCEQVLLLPALSVNFHVLVTTIGQVPDLESL